MGQMVEDVRLGVNGKKPVYLHSSCGGNVPSSEEVAEFVILGKTER